jgi:succinate dehydrogenase assembly factor 2
MSALKYIANLSNRLSIRSMLLPNNTNVRYSTPLSVALLRQQQQQQQQQQQRFYRGEAGEGASTLSESEQLLYERAKPRSDEILAKHFSLPDLSVIPQSSFDPSSVTAATSTNSNDSEELALDIRRKRLVYRAKQRGWLEVDLLLGMWASENVPSLNLNELDQFEDFVNFETIDIYNIITLRLDVPDHLKTSNGDGIVERIQEWAKSSPLGKADPEQYKKAKHDANLI